VPNHIQNRITADEATMLQIRERFRGPEASVDFNRLIRMPEHQPGVFFAEGGLGRDEEEANPCGNWHDWSRFCWGTKWGAYGVDDKRDTPTLLHFQTAWAHPRPIVSALAAALPDASWTWEYADEDRGQNLGKYRVEAGRIYFDTVPEEGSKAARAWADALHGSSWDDDEDAEAVH